MSPSSRGRGLKSQNQPFIVGGEKSPSSRGRGLKFIELEKEQQTKQVALFTRAWIEMSLTSSLICDIVVALFTRAWIEIL